MTREEIEEVRRRAYETIASIDETLERTRPDPTVEQRQTPTSHYRGYVVETVANMLKASEARINKRLDGFEARLAETRQQLIAGLEVIAEESGEAAGKNERKANEEIAGCARK